MAERSLLDRPRIVDDHASFRKAMERRLKKAGYEVMTYPSAQHLLDRMPGESELGRILRRKGEYRGMSGTRNRKERLSKLGSTVPFIFPTD